MLVLLAGCPFLFVTIFLAGIIIHNLSRREKMMKKSRRGLGRDGPWSGYKITSAPGPGERNYLAVGDYLTNGMGHKLTLLIDGNLCLTYNNQELWCVMEGGRYSYTTYKAHLKSDGILQVVRKGTEKITGGFLQITGAEAVYAKQFFTGTPGSEFIMSLSKSGSVRIIKRVAGKPDEYSFLRLAESDPFNVLCADGETLPCPDYGTGGCNRRDEQGQILCEQHGGFLR